VGREHELSRINCVRAKECLYLFGSRTERVNGHVERVSGRYSDDSDQEVLDATCGNCKCSTLTASHSR